MAGVFGREAARSAIDVGELTGWRFWRVRLNHTGQLQSYSQNYTWLPGTNEANGVPGEDNMYGFYAFKDPKKVITYMPPRFHGEVACLGMIDMWGEVVEGTWGYRSQYASIFNVTTVIYQDQGTSYLYWDSFDAIPPKRQFITNCRLLMKIRKRYRLEMNV